MNVPARSGAQRENALDRANRVRSTRARFRRDITLERAARAVARPAWWQTTMKVDLLLRCLPGWGPRRAGRMLVGCRIASGKTLGGLSIRQREMLAADLLANGYRPKGKP